MNVEVNLSKNRTRDTNIITHSFLGINMGCLLIMSIFVVDRRPHMTSDGITVV